MHDQNELLQFGDELAVGAGGHGSRPFVSASKPESGSRVPRTTASASFSVSACQLGIACVTNGSDEPLGSKRP